MPEIASFEPTDNWQTKFYYTSVKLRSVIDIFLFGKKYNFLFGNKYNCLIQMLGYHQVCNDALFLEKQIFGKKVNSFFRKAQNVIDSHVNDRLKFT